jgi:DNA polymerase-3 subunit gamma/tau
MLSTAAFNALLKTLEEPPAHVKFMFATTDPEKVLPTILSRCQRYDLRRIPADLISKHLAEIAKKEKVKIDAAALYAIARGAEGALRDAESTLDQLISFCGDKIEESDVLSMFGLTAQSQLLELSRAMLAGEVENSLRQLNHLATHGKDLGRLLSDLLNHFRNLLIFQVSRGDLKMLEVSEAEEAALAAQSKMVSAEGFTRIMEVLADAEMRLRDAASKKISIEVALLKAIEARQAVNLDTVLKKLEELRADEAGAVAQVVGPKPFRAAAGSLQPVCDSANPPLVAAVREVPPATPIPQGDLAGLWSNLVEAVGRVSLFTRTYLLEAHPVSFKNKVLMIGFPPASEDHLSLVDNSRNHELLQAKLAELGHSQAQIKFIKSEPPVGWSAPTEPPVSPLPVAPAAPAKTVGPARSATPPSGPPKPTLVPFDKEQFKNDPLIQKALEIFKGQIVEIRV